MLSLTLSAPFRWFGFLLLLAGSVGILRSAPEYTRPAEVSLNGNDWTFLPVRLPFFGYEMDAPGRWKAANQDHAFIRQAIDNPANNWTTPVAVRVPMAWSGSTSNPGSSETVGDFDFPHFWQYVHKGVYERRFDVPGSYAGHRVTLRFSSVNLKCWVYVNDVLVTPSGQSYTHRGKHPFSIDITPHVQPGSKDNTLRVVVQDFTDALRGTYPNEDHPDSTKGIDFPLGYRSDYYNKDRSWRVIDSGIVGDVILSAHPLVHVSDVFVTTSVADHVIDAEFEVRNDGTSRAVLRPSLEVRTHRGDELSLRFDAQDEIALQPGESQRVKVRQEWKDPELWWPHRPFLYDLVISLEAQGQPMDTRRQRFGFREVHVVRSNDDDLRGFYINGVRTRLFGESSEPTWKDGYTEGVFSSGLYLYNRAYWTFLLRTAKSMGINSIRTHLGMWTQEMFEVADEVGMMMIAASTIDNERHSGAIGTEENQIKAIRDMVSTLRNHPSVVIWGLANECHYKRSWAEAALSLDSTRPLVATQTGDHPELLGPGRSYAMGLSGYEPNIYHRHDRHWKPALMFVYEDNACYDQPSVPERVEAVQKGLTIFRGHRASGYELISTFYTFQKAFGQPSRPEERRLAIKWTDAEAAKLGYHPDFATMPLFDPWTNPDEPRILNPIEGYADNPVDFWRRSFSPVAVFDWDFDQRSSIGADANPYIAPLDAKRKLTIHNDDLTDLSEAITVRHEVIDPETKAIISQGSFDIVVPQGGVRSHPLELDLGGRSQVLVKYRAYKSGAERFSETIRLRESARQATEPYMAQPAGLSFEMQPGQAGFEAKGYSIQSSTTQDGKAVVIAVASNPNPDDFVAFNPWIGHEGQYDVFLWVPPGMQGIQRFDIRHDTLNTTGEIDLSTSGWIRLGNSSYRMDAGRMENSIRLVPSGKAQRSVIGPIKLERSR